MKKCIVFILGLLLFAVYCSNTFANNNMVTISGFAQPIFVIDPKTQPEHSLANVHVIALETGKEVYVTGKDGKFQFKWPKGQPLTLMYKCKDYMTSQSNTIIPQKDILPGDKFHLMTYQAIPGGLYLIIKELVQLQKNVKMSPDKYQIIATVFQHNKTLYDGPHGYPDTKVFLSSNDTKTGIDFFAGDRTFYLGIVKGLPNPVSLGRETTSLDGGVVFMNVDTPKDGNPGYYLLPYCPHAKFTNKPFATINKEWWYKNAPGEPMLVNIAPPQGPRADKDADSNNAMGKSFDLNTLVNLTKVFEQLTN